MSAPRSRQRLGLHQIVPSPDSVAGHTTIDIIAIHGLGTESPRTWEFKRSEGRVVNWLADEDMLPATVPGARIFTYDWNANYFQDAPVQTLLGHADTLLAHIAETRDVKSRPIIFIASCFGGLVLIEAINRAGQEGSPYRHVLLSTVGIVFLATPFNGADASREARWQVVVGGIMGEDTSDELIKDLERKHDLVHRRVQKFTEIANADAMRLHLYCFFETKKTEILRRVFPSSWARRFSTRFTHKILVTESSACLLGFPSLPLDVTHSGMNKFDGPGNSCYKLVKDQIRRMANDAWTALNRRQSSPRQHWMVPFERNEGFVGREDVLRLVLDRISPSANKDACQRTVIQGLGGIGKTQIALEAAFRLRDADPSCSVFWVPAVDATTFENAYRDIGQRLGVAGLDDDKADVKALVQAAMSHRDAGQWLLIIDNADDPELMFGSGALACHLPCSTKGSILFTTRTREVTNQLDIYAAGIIEPTKMKREEAREMLQARLREDQVPDRVSTDSLLDFLDDLPLAIRQASAYMFKTGISTARYLEHCLSSDATLVKLLSQEFEDRGRYDRIKNPVATTWLISFKHISRDSPQAGEYLEFMCFLAERDVPISLLAPASDEMETEEAVGTLEAYGFITRREEGESLDMHRLVRLAMWNWIRQEGQARQRYCDVVQRLDEVFPFPEHENREIWMRYMAHAQRVVESDEECEDEEAMSGLLFNVAEALSIQGRYEGAAKLYRETLEVREEIFGKEDLSTLDSMNNLASVLGNMGEYKEAEKMHRETLELKEKVLGKEHPNTLDSMNNLALVLDDMGEYEEAEKMHRETLEAREKVLGKEHPSTLDSMNNLATVLDDMGEYEEAEKMHRETLEAREKVLGKEHPSTFSSMNNLALVLGKIGEYKEAEKMHREGWKLTEKVLGKEHPSTLDSMNNLALVLGKIGEYEEAEEMYRETLEAREKVLGKEHPSTVDSMNNLATVLGMMGKYKEAEEMYRETLEAREKVLGKEHPSTLDSMNNLAAVLGMMGKYKEAEEMHREGWKLTEKVLGKEHPSTLSSMNNLAAVLGKIGEYEEAEEIYRETLEAREKVLGKEHPDTLDSMNNLAVVLDKMGEYEEAEKMHRETLELKEKVLGKEHPSTLSSMNNLALVLVKMGEYEEAEKMYRETLEAREKVLGKEHPDTLMSMNNLANVLRKIGKYKEAEKMHREGWKLKEEVFMKNSMDRQRQSFDS